MEFPSASPSKRSSSQSSSSPKASRSSPSSSSAATAAGSSAPDDDDDDDDDDVEMGDASRFAEMDDLLLGTDAGEPVEMLTLKCKWNGKDLVVSVAVLGTLGDLKRELCILTDVLPVRQKVMGLGTKANSAPDLTPLATFKVKQGTKLRMMGSREESIAMIGQAFDEADNSDLLDDLDWDYTQADASELLQDPEARLALQKCTDKTTLRMMAQPREGKKLLVLDLDHTLLHFSRDHAGPVNEMKRPHMDRFLAALHPYYDFVVWSQTSWRWLELKLTQLGFLSNPAFHVTFVLDKTAMFNVRRKHNGKVRDHQVKALELIWAKCPQWNAGNSVHVDDLARNFAMNPEEGVKCSAYMRKDIATDYELLELGVYLKHLGQNVEDFRSMDHNRWKKTVRKLRRKAEKDAAASTPSNPDASTGSGSAARET